MSHQTIKFYNGNTYPILGLGTWRSQPNEVTQAVIDAIDAGYRHIDCAAAYANEPEVGAAIAAKIKDGTIRREDIFVTSKLWNTCHRPELVEPALKKTLKDLGLETLDLYLMHWPMAFKEGNAKFPEDSKGKLLYENIDYVDTWRAMESLVGKGLAKDIGVSNFNSKQLERLLSKCKLKPVTNQVECHPYFAQTKLSELCKSEGITITAFSPFAQMREPKVFDDPKIQELADKYKKTPAQIVLRYQVQRGHLVIPKSVSKSRIHENVNIFDFELSGDDMKQMMSLDRNERYCPFPQSSDHKYYPFNEEF